VTSGVIPTNGADDGAHTADMASDHQRMKLTPAQAASMNEAVVGAPQRVIEAAGRIGRGEVVPDADAEAVVDALTSVMLGGEGYSEAEGLTERGIEIDDLIGVVQQMSEHFYD
jgi:hypothetical protein